MNRILTKQEINYVFFHLEQHIKLPDKIKKFITFAYNLEIKEFDQPGIVFYLSSEGLDEKKIYNIDDIPVLFPIGSMNQFYSMKGDTVFFHHDIIKSAFYLLSGYQEYKSKKRDHLGRYLYDYSLQKELDIAHKPLVNYYFNYIIHGIESFCQKNHLQLQKKQAFNNFGFTLSHDVDRVDSYHIFEVLLKVKQFMGMSPSPYPPKIRFRLMLQSLFEYCNIFSKKNPFWNFEFLRNIEKRLHIKSVFYFLNRGQLHIDARYSLKEKRIRKLIEWLAQQERCEIGLHGTFASATTDQKLPQEKKKLEDVCSLPVKGCRQHFLNYKLPLTSTLQHQAGFIYSSTLGFPDHEGFRNSYCHPFKLFDFETQEIIDIWEIPLIMMEVTVLGYRKLDFDHITTVTETLLHEVQKFNGIYTLLWHNCQFDENLYPGIKTFYEKLLKLIVSKKPEKLTGIGVTDKLTS